MRHAAYFKVLEPDAFRMTTSTSNEKYLTREIAVVCLSLELYFKYVKSTNGSFKRDRKNYYCKDGVTTVHSRKNLQTQLLLSRSAEVGYIT